MRGIIQNNEQIANDIFSMTIYQPEVAQMAEIGQFVNIYTRDKSTLLPRPISISEINETTITIVYAVVGQGTAEFATYNEGEKIEISTPQGNGFQVQDVKTSVLVGGGVGVPPLVELAKQIKGNKIVVLGFRDEPFLVDKFEQLGATVYVATDSGKHGFKGNVLELIKKEGIVGDYYYSCGPKPMLRALASEFKDNLQVSMEERMGCGYGACVGCVCKTKDGLKKVCTDGPVFNGGDVQWT
ncbi:MAG: oxidoreductase [Epulopiscium sp. Nele67-Bin004]|nr:MAG: oxidoreductase [Epulopiscium sp. Nele67-Bin004]